MTKLSEMILDVRSELSDVPEDKLTDLQVYNGLKDAKYYVDSIKTTTATQTQLDECYKAVACVYVYVIWTSLAERLMNTQPSTFFARVQFLREKAIARLQHITTYPLNKDLTVDMKSISNIKVDGVVLTYSLLAEYSETGEDFIDE